MISAITNTFIYILPGGVANASPPLITRIDVVKKFNKPIDFGWKFIDGKRLFGNNKTILGFFGGTLFGTLSGLLVYTFMFTNKFSIPGNNLLIYSFIVSFGALFGDLLKSFIKRRLDIKTGEPFIPFDQIDYGLGMFFFIRMFYPTIEINLWVLLLLAFVLHLIFKYLGFLIKVREKPI